jgi:alpha-glucosidase
MTSRAHQLAMYVVYDSPLQMVADYPGAYRGQPGADFLRAVPASWDETRVLQGGIGEFIVVARRRGREWFVGAMTNERPRAITVPLNFLDAGGGGDVLTEYGDGFGADADPKRLAVLARKVRAGEKLNLRLAPSGGYAARFVPAK